MKNQEEYEKNLPEIMAIPSENNFSLPYPVEYIIDEALDLSVSFIEDKPELLAVGLNENYMNTLASRAVSLRYAEMLWKEAQGKEEDAGKEWNANKDSAMNFKNEMLHDFRFAYRNNPAILRKVKDIAEGDSYPDMVQDLGNLSVLGRENPEPLQKINYNMENITTADVLSTKMGELLALVNGERNNSSKEKIIRDKAFLYLNEAFGTVREYGKYVFWKDKERLKKYTSDYLRKHRSKKDPNAETDTNTEPDSNN